MLYNLRSTGEISEDDLQSFSGNFLFGVNIAFFNFFYIIFTMKETQNIIGEWYFSVRDTKTGNIRTHHEYNIIPTVAKTAFASQIAGDNTQQIGTSLYVAL